MARIHPVLLRIYWNRIIEVVDKDNPKAKILYFKLGFAVTDCRLLAGRMVEHLTMDEV